LQSRGTELGPVMPLQRRRSTVEHQALRVFYQFRDEKPWISTPAGLDFELLLRPRRASCPSGKVMGR
jgi:hypothetical protein